MVGMNKCLMVSVYFLKSFSYNFLFILKNVKMKYKSESNKKTLIKSTQVNFI